MENGEEKELEQPIDDGEVMALALEAGRILLENGAEIFRVEETMHRICQYYGVKSANQFVLSNGIFVTAGDRKEQVYAKVQHIPVSDSYLERVAAVNQLSRRIVEGKYTVSEAMAELEKIKLMPEKTKYLQIMASAVGCGAFCYLFGGDIMDCMAAFISGIFLYLYVLFIKAPYMSKIVGNVGGGALVTITCHILYICGLGHHFNFIIIGSVMPLVPGVAFTNAIRDIADGDYISGSVRMLDALLIFFCIAIGVGMGLTILNAVTGGASL